VAQSVYYLVAVRHRVSRRHPRLAAAAREILYRPDPSWSDVVDLVSQDFLFFERSEEGVLVLFLLLGLDGLAALVGRVVLLVGRTRQLDEGGGTFSVCMRRDRKRDLVSEN
jgi:hypothetical protein